MIDYHIHTKLCKHAQGEVHEFVEAAVAAGIKEMAFTDHIPLPDNFDLRHRMAYREMEQYCRWIESLRRQYPEIKIKLGIEADYYRGFETYLFQFLNHFDFDVVIMAIHFIRHWPDGNWIFGYDFPGKSVAEIYLDYLDTAVEGIQTGLFDILGHADIIKQPDHPLLFSVSSDVARLLSEIKSAGMALEINTSGYRKQIGESYPALNWIPLAQRQNVPLTIGSDAHKPDQVALQFRHIYRLFNHYQINWLATFSKRQMNRYSLNSEW
jgi:histidinol-phosphatase (PHP family)